MHPRWATHLEILLTLRRYPGFAMPQEPSPRHGIDAGTLMVPHYIQRARLGGPYWPLVAPASACT